MKLNKSIKIFLFLLGVFLVVNCVKATTYTIILNESNNGNVGDAQTNGANGYQNKNYGASFTMNGGRDGSGNLNFAFTLWNMSVVPSGYKIQSANLSLLYAGGNFSGNLYLSTYNTSLNVNSGVACDLPWVEGIGSGEANTTCNQLTNNSMPLAYLGTIQDTINPNNNWNYWNVTDAVISAYELNQNMSIAVGNHSATNRTAFRTKENSTVTFRPQLVITYRDPPSVCINETGLCFDSIQTAINAATANQTVIVTNSSVYNENVVLNVTGLTLTSNSTNFPTINATDYKDAGLINSALYIKNNNTVVKNLNVHNNNTEDESFAVYLYRTVNSLNNVTVDSVNVYLNGTSDSVGISSGNQGSNGARNLLISNSNITIAGSGSYGIDISSPYANLTNNIIINTGQNEYSAGDYLLEYGSYGIKIISSNVTLQGNQINSTKNFGLYFGRWNSYLFNNVYTNITADTTNLIWGKPLYYYEGNNYKIQNLTDAGSIIVNGNNADISNNTLSNKEGITLYFSNYSQVHNNSINVSMFGIYFNSAAFSNISSNTLTVNSTNEYTPIYIEHSSDSIIDSNTINCWKNFCIYFSGTSYNRNFTVTNNNIKATNDCDYILRMIYVSASNISYNNFTALSGTDCGFSYVEVSINNVFEGDNVNVTGGDNGYALYIEGNPKNNIFKRLNLIQRSLNRGGVAFSNGAENNTFIDSNITILGLVQDIYPAVKVSGGTVSQPWYRSLNNTFYNTNITTNGSYGIYISGMGFNTSIYNSYIKSTYNYDIYLNGFNSSNTLNLINTTFINLNISNLATNNGTVYIQYYFNANVKDTVGNPIQTADVVVKDVYGDTVYSGQTDSNGNIPQQILTEFLANRTYNSTSGYYYYSNYTIDVSKSGYVTDSTQLNMTESQILNFELFGNEWIVKYTYRLGNIISNNIFSMFKLGSLIPYIVAGTLVIGSIVVWILA